MKNFCVKKGERGFALITVYLVLAVLIVLVGALVSYTFAEVIAAQRSQAFTQALYLAEAGIDTAIVQLRSNSNWSGGTGSQGAGTYSVTVQSLGNNRQRLTAQGSSTLLQTPAVRTVEAIVRVTPNPLFQFSLFGNQSVTLTGNASTDSYDSSIGPYGGSNRGSQGDVGTNGTGLSSIGLNGNARVNGNAVSGVGSDPNTAITTTGNAVITGSRTAQDSAFVLPPVTIPGGLSNSGALNVSGNTTLTLPGGTYWYSSVSISGNGAVYFGGPAVVYVTGDVSVSGNGIGTANSRPPNLILYVQGTHTVSVSGNGNFYGGVYAPNSSVSVSGNGAFYGAAIGNTTTNNGNGGLHYDLALRGAVAGAGSTVQVLSWQDLS